MSPYSIRFPSIRLRRWFRRNVEAEAVKRLGGPRRLRVIVLLATVLGLDTADKATVGALAVPLKQAFNVGNFEIGALIAVSTLVTALATLPFGLLADRTNRRRLLAVSIGVWATAMAVNGASVSYMMLLISRLALGAAIASVVPIVASLTGDFFHPGERARVWGYILAGELVGTALGYLIAGNLAAVFSWRISFWVLAALSAALAPAVWRWLPEPTRGGQSASGATGTPSGKNTQEPVPTERHAEAGSDVPESEVEELVEERDVSPRESLVLRQDPLHMSLWRSVRYVLSIRTNVVLISASALGYFFLTGLQTFAVVFLRARFGLSQSAASTLGVALGTGAILGVLLSGRIADRLLDRGMVTARIVVPALAFPCTALFLLPSLLVSSLLIAAPLFFLAAVAMGGTNPPLDAARLDIMHFRLWGRAESVRSVLRFSFQALAPIAFGWVSMLFGAAGSTFGLAAEHTQQNATALGQTFLVMLIPLASAGLILCLALKPYPRDVATAHTSEQETR